MPRIPEETIERLKQEVSLEKLATARGVKLTRHGADLIGLCPFHEDREPSLVISPKKNLWHCLGACQAGGTAIDWVMKAEGVSFRHAVELLRENVPVGESHAVKTSTVRRLPPPVDRAAGDAEMLEQVVAYYHETLKQSPEALKYLESRGLTHPEMIGEFRLGYANRTLGLRLPAKNRKAGDEMRTRLQTLGVIRESGHEHFNGSIVIPMFDASGAVVEMYGRKITANLREGTPLHLYLPGEHRGVWNEKALEASKEIILCESLIDALTFWCAGFRNVTASYGVNGFTDDHRGAFKKHGVKQVWIAYDRDEAGDTAAEKLKEELSKLGIGSHRVLFPRGCDANEYALKVTPSSQSLAVLLNGAEWLTRPAAKEKPQPVIPLAAETELKTDGDEITMQQGDRRYRIRGLAKNTGYEVLKVNVLVSRGDLFHVDTLDLQLDRQRAAFVKRAAEELGMNEEMLRKDLGRVFLALERLQADALRKTLDPAKPVVEMSDEERQESLELLRDPKLLDRVLEDFASCGLIGEETNKLIGYLAAVSRHLEAPLAIVVQSSSAAGKSSLMDAVLAFVPEEERIQYSAMTGQSLYYMGEMDLKHKVLAIVEEEGASRASYALKLLQSEGEISIASTGKDPATGKLVTHQYRVEGPVMMFLTTTAIDVDEELMNRCLVLTVDEDREQTRAIHRLQREQQTLEGLLRKQEKRAILRRHRNAQRLLKPLAVVNPYVAELAFPDALTRMRRDHMKYLTLIRAIALLHQHQRQVKTERGVSYIEATREDIATADRLMKELMRRSLDDLPPQTRRLLELIAQMSAGREAFQFSRREVRAHTGWGETQVRLHLDRLQEMEYLLVHQGGRGQSFLYEYDANFAGGEEHLAGGSRPERGGFAGRRNPYIHCSKWRLSWCGRKTRVCGGMMGKTVRKRKPAEPPATVLAALLEKYFEHLRVRNYSEFTIKTCRVQMKDFFAWSAERGITEPMEVTRTVLESYQRHVFHYRRKNGEPMSFTSQRDKIATLRTWFRWMARSHHILHNPASELELPRVGLRLPKAILTAQEAEQIIAIPDIFDPLGLRDRAILETLYSTGMRRMELVNLKVWDIDLNQATVNIRQGKGKKDRFLPLGDRAAAWVRKYIDEARPHLASEPDDKILFLSNNGDQFSLDYLTEIVGGYVQAAGIGKKGACHLFRHTMATLMLEGGAEIRFIQAMLGHANLNTTQIYTHVAVKQLQAIHRATHPASQETPKREMDELPGADGSHDE